MSADHVGAVAAGQAQRPSIRPLQPANPPLAHRALAADRSIGLLLPCNIVVRATPAGTVVEALDPQIMATLTGRPELKPVADEAARRLAAALADLKECGKE